MLFEIVTVFMVIGFIFLALGILPTGKTTDMEGNESQTPYLNKIIFTAVAAIIFIAMGMTAASLDYNYCYIENTTSDFNLNMTVSQATCASYKIESTDLSYINYGMGMVSFLVFIILMLFAGLARKELRGRD